MLHLWRILIISYCRGAPSLSFLDLDVDLDVDLHVDEDAARRMILI